jgi:2-oxo-3-hexenedioate decarboxylase
MSDLISKAAKALANARQAKSPLDQASISGLTDLQKAYNVQLAGVDLMRQSGDKLVGLKMGFTSQAKMLQMGVQEMIFGHLTSSMSVQDGDEVGLSKFIHPRVEPEIAFLMKADLPSEIDASRITSYVEAVAPALEIIDSRYSNFKFDLPLVIADNTSAAGFALGPWCKTPPDISNLGMLMRIGNTQNVGSSAAILGNPWRSLTALLRLARHYGVEIPPGSVILAGASTSAPELKHGARVDLQVSQLGRLSFYTSTS